MMGKLSEISRELVARIRSEVEFEERLIGYRLHLRLGPSPISLYSFEEVFGLLNDPHPRLGFHKLAKWIREVMGEVIGADCCNQDKSLQIRDLMGERLIQCHKIL